MAVFQPPPVFDLPIRVDEEEESASSPRESGRSRPRTPWHRLTEFSPVWLDWFYRLVGILNGSGISDGTISYTEQTIVAGQTMAPRQPAQRRVDDSQIVVAQQVFGG